MNASFGCKGEIHLEVVEMFPSRRGSLSLGSKETSPSLSEFAGAFLVIAFPVAQEDGEAVGARVFQHLVAAAVLCCHAQRVQNLCFDGGEHDGDDLVDAAGRAVGDGIDDRTCFGCAIADDFGFFQLAAQKLTGRVGNA